MPKGAAIPRPRTIQVRFGRPLHLQADLKDRATWQAAANTVREAVLQLEARAG
jgi:hypothetical protein